MAAVGGLHHRSRARARGRPSAKHLYDRGCRLERRDHRPEAHASALRSSRCCSWSVTLDCGHRNSM
eukprot:722667-Prymnesium_polylepis.2